MMMTLLSTGLVCLSLLGATATAAPSLMPEKSDLLGKWTHKRLEQTSEGKLIHAVDSNGDNAIEFKSDGTWQLTAPANKNSGTYFWIDRTSIDTTITASHNKAQIGWRSVKRIAVDAGSLTMITVFDDPAVGQPRAGGGPRPKVIVTSTFVRAAPAKKR